MYFREVLFNYDSVTDTGYFGIRTVCITSDVDCDGDPCTANPDAPSHALPHSLRLFAVNCLDCQPLHWRCKHSPVTGVSACPRACGRVAVLPPPLPNPASITPANSGGGTYDDLPNIGWSTATGLFVGESFLVVINFQDNLNSPLSVTHGANRVGVGSPLGVDASTGHDASSPIAFTLRSTGLTLGGTLTAYRSGRVCFWV